MTIEKPQPGAPGTTEQSPRWEGPEATRPRGYLPARTYSAHWIANPSFRRAVADYLEREREYVDRDIDMLGEHSPFRHDGGGNAHFEDEF